MKTIKNLSLLALLSFFITLPLINWNYSSNTLFIPLILFAFFCIIKLMVYLDNEDKYNVGF